MRRTHLFNFFILLRNKGTGPRGWGWGWLNQAQKPCLLSSSFWLLPPHPGNLPFLSTVRRVVMFVCYLGGLWCGPLRSRERWCDRQLLTGFLIPSPSNQGAPDFTQPSLYVISSLLETHTVQPNWGPPNPPTGSILSSLYICSHSLSPRMYLSATSATQHF